MSPWAPLCWAKAGKMQGCTQETVRAQAWSRRGLKRAAVTQGRPHVQTGASVNGAAIVIL